MRGPGGVLGRRYFLPVIMLILALSPGNPAGSQSGDSDAPVILNCLESITCDWPFPNTGLDMFRAIASDGQGGIFGAGWKGTSGAQKNNWLIQRLEPGCGWGWNYGTDFDDYDEVMDVAVDSQGNVLASGWRHYEGEHAWLVAKLDTEGTLQWMHPYKIDGTGEGWCRGRGICRDHQDNVYVAGFTHVVAIPEIYRAIRKYGSDGTFIKEWPIYMFAWDIAYGYDAQLGQHYLVVVGYEETPAQGYDIRAARYDLEGNLAWEYQYNGPGDGNDEARGVAISGKQEIFISGCETSLSSGSLGVLIKLDHRTGEEVDKAIYDDSTNDQFRGVAVDSRGYVAVAGQKQAFGQSENWIVALYDSSCELLCSTQYNNSLYNGSDIAWGAVFDLDGSVVVGGYEHAPDMDWRVMKYTFTIAPVPSFDVPQVLYQGALRVFPNPFIRSQAVRGTVKFDGLDLGAKVRIYTVRGLLVWEGTVHEPYILEWNGCNKEGKPVAPGTYLWVAESQDAKRRGTLVVE